MKCAEFETLLCDYVDGTLAPDRKSGAEQHLGECETCAGLARDCSLAVTFIGRASAVEPPHELLTRIAFNIPAGLRRRRGAMARFHRIFGPILQPRFAMGMAMTILSFSMLSQFLNIPIRQLTVDDLRPARVWGVVEDKVHRVWDRGVKYYESMRFFVEIQSKLKDLTATDPAAQAPSATPGSNSPAGAAGAGDMSGAPGSLELAPKGGSNQ
ncbi:MAG: zf-HC2 domain-containing protein [Bryobacteraceae bacterium]|nr:zf-HC2 domain-containing protein [Bryobacterales bacterium]MEB2360335.1 zf-HC2 domain-containing protein [Bryobacterales bacterium]NUN01180.1 zf-HC2 domain-containing protein [Bryobacteraceae bacterium]